MEEFIIPHNGNFIYFSPLKSKAILINGSLKELVEKEDVSDLDEESKRVLDEFKGMLDVEQRKVNVVQDIFNTNTLAILPTNKCDLGCVYCYSQERRGDITLETKVGAAAVNHLISNVKRNGYDKASILFHGGGEPTLAWDFLTSVSQYAKECFNKMGVKLSLGISTNGILSERKLEWITGNIDNLQVSFDGIAEIQNMHRPFRNGKSSFDAVARTLRYFNDVKKQFVIRSTITSKSLPYLDESIDFIAREFKPKKINLEPVSICGGCKKDEHYDPGVEFVKEFLKIWEKYNKNGIFYSNSNIFKLKFNFCGACGFNFIITPEGYVSTCFEVESPDDALGDILLVGKFNGEGFSISQDKIDYLKSRNLENLPYCSDCFVKYSCAGDCLTRVYRDNHDIFKTGHSRCCTNREIGKAMLIKKVEE